MRRQITLVLVAVLLAASLFNFAPQPRAVQAVSPDIVISQVYGGGGNAGATLRNDFIELFNRGSVAVDVTGWTVQYAATTGSSWARTILSGSIPSGGYYLIQQAAGQGGTVSLPTPDATGTIAMGASAGKVALVNNSILLTGSCPAGLVDFVGFGSNTDCFEGTGPTGTLSNTTAALRASNGCTDTDSNAADFTVGAPAPRNSASPTNVCGAPPADTAPSVASTNPIASATGVAVDANITVTFSEPVNVTASWFTLDCTLSGLKTAAVSGGPSSFTLNPDSDFSFGESCTLTVLASQVSDVDADDPPDVMVSDFTLDFSVVEANVCESPYTPIYSIQGSGLSAAITGNVTTQGIVVGDFETNSALQGFFLQDLSGDGDTNTSDGIFVFTGTTADTVNAGDVVRVTGFARERFNMTTLNGSNSNSAVVPAANITICGSGSVAPVDITMPFPGSTYLERFEGMLVRFPQALTIAEYFNFDQFGEMVLALPLDGEPRPFTPTVLEEPGAAALARAEANSLRRITLDDGRGLSNPSPPRHPNGSPFTLDNLFRGGDLVQNATGVLHYDFNLYRIQPTGPAEYIPTNPRPAAPEAVGGSTRVAAMNTLNFFLTPDYPTGNPLDNKCGPFNSLECRGADADQPLEFTRQRDKLLAALVGLDADIIGLNEIENSLGVDPLGDPTNGIVAGLNAIYGPGEYASIDTGVIGTDAIRVGLIYRPAVVTPVGPFKILTSAVDPRFIDTLNRPALAQTFEVLSTGARFTVAVNHLKSKGSPCLGDPDLGDGQGNCNGTRTLAAEALVDWLASDPTGSGDPDFLIIGDLNSYAKEDPIQAVLKGPDDILGTADDYTNLIALYQGPYAYSYVFDGQVGYLDHALASASLLAQTRGATEWHINADETDILDYDTTFKGANEDALYEPNAYRSSDHDPVLVGLQLNNAPVLGPVSVTPNPVEVNQAVTAGAAFTDQGDSLPHSGVWNWGDGTTSPAVITEAGGAGSAAGEHVYTATGIYTVTLTLADTDGAWVQGTFQNLVVYNPLGGFVTGEGWINSAGGAYLPDPKLKDKGVFEFVVRYPKNSTLPDGALKFKLRKVVDFVATSFDWLVVDGTTAHFQGTGTLNGMPGYKFSVSLGDGKPDTFRIVIWSGEGESKQVVYDNGYLQPLAGGFVAIHK